MRSRPSVGALERKSGTQAAASATWAAVEPRLNAPAVAPLFEHIDAGHELAGLAGAQSVSAELADALWAVAGPRQVELALGLAANVRPSSYGLLTYLLATSDTVAQTLHRLRRHYALLSSAARYEVDGRSLALEVAGHRPSVGRGMFGVAVAVGFLRAEVRGSFALSEVDLEMREPTVAIQHACARFFGTEVRFGARRTRVVVDKTAWHMPLRGADPQLGELLEAQARVRQTKPSVTQRVEEVLRVRSDPTLSMVSEALRMAPRSVRRHLEREGSSFRALLDEARCRRAEALLTAGASNAATAEALGYCDAAAFRKAFKRWMHVTPDVYRSALRGQAGSSEVLGVR